MLLKFNKKRKSASEGKKERSLPYETVLGAKSVGLLLEPRVIEINSGEDKEMLLAVATYAYEGELRFKAELIYPPFHRIFHPLPKGVEISFDPSPLKAHYQSIARVTVNVEANKFVKPGKYTISVHTDPLRPPFGSKTFVLTVT
jgi:hypothetical protein